MSPLQNWVDSGEGLLEGNLFGPDPQGRVKAL